MGTPSVALKIRQPHSRQPEFQKFQIDTFGLMSLPRASPMRHDHSLRSTPISDATRQIARRQTSVSVQQVRNNAVAVISHRPGMGFKYKRVSGIFPTDLSFNLDSHLHRRALAGYSPNRTERFPRAFHARKFRLLLFISAVIYRIRGFLSLSSARVRRAGYPVR